MKKYQIVNNSAPAVWIFYVDADGNTINKAIEPYTTVLLCMKQDSIQFLDESLANDITTTLVGICDSVTTTTTME